MEPLHRLPFYLLALLLLGFSTPSTGSAKSLRPAGKIQILASGRKVSLRGISVVSSRVIWVSGDHGTIARSLDGGKSWTWMSVPGLENRDFRSLHAFGSGVALAAAAGAPALIVRTVNGGVNWNEVYRNGAPASFLDGIAFWDQKRGLAYGDPLDGRLLVLSTENGGARWSELPAGQRPPTVEGEAGFAASGTSIRAWGSGMSLIATGGKRALLWESRDFGRSWTTRTCPIRQGAPSQGIFSVAVSGNDWVVVGGDYRRSAERNGVACWSSDGGRTWSAPKVAPGGYRSAVEALGGPRFLATGPNGTDLSVDGGFVWHPISPQGFHAIGREPNGAGAYLVGSGGRIAHFSSGSGQ